MLYRFGEHILDTEGIELHDGSVAVALEPQAFLLLQFLIENRERVVSKDEIIQAVWDGRAVSDSALTYAMNTVRRAVGDDGKAQAVIKTFPRRGFRFVAEVADEVEEREAPATSPGTPGSEKPSIAVLPFENLSGEQEQEYFSDGITEDIITALSRIRQLIVTARNTTFAYKGQAMDVPAIALELNVRYVLTGSVRKAGNRVRISAQLVDGMAGNQLWAEQYDRDLQDIFAVQDEIKHTVVGALQPELTRSEIERARRKPTDSLDAWDLCQRGFWHLFSVSSDDIAEAIELFSKAIELDPDFVGAHVGLAESCLIQRAWGYTIRDPQDAFAAARRAVELDPQDASAHRALGATLFATGDHPAAIAECNRAIQLNPSDAQIYFWLGFAQTYSGNAVEALNSFNYAINLSPRDIILGRFYGGLTVSYLFLKRHDEAVEAAQKSIQNPPVPWTIRSYLASALAHLDRAEEAAKAIEHLLEAQPRCTTVFFKEHLFITDEAYREHLFDGLRKAGLPE